MVLSMSEVSSLKQRLRSYAHLAIRHGLNVQQNQLVRVAAEVVHRDFAILLVEEAYKAGARLVILDFDDPRALKALLTEGDQKNLAYVPKFVKAKFDELLEEDCASLSIVGSAFPTLFSDIDPKKLNERRIALHGSRKKLYDEGISKGKLQWCVVAGATPLWGKRIFPNASNPEDQLWNAILSASRISEDPQETLREWESHNERLQQRARRLNNEKLQTIRFVGPGTDLTVELSPHALFKGGTDLTPKGVHYSPNIPTEEVFTTPDCRKTEGHVRVTRPFTVNETLVTEATLTFKEGKIVACTASQGLAALQSYIDSDVGARMLGEVALVGIDSPIFQSRVIFEEILFDENAACHIAVGSAYHFCLEGSESMSRESLDAIGCNESIVHTDMMISDASVDVIGTTRSGKESCLIQQGVWQRGL
jgi:aminopeptidase